MRLQSTDLVPSVPASPRDIMAETVKVPTFSGKAADFPVFRTKFTVYADALGLGGVLDCEDDVTTAQQKRLYNLLVLALPEAALHVIRKDERKSATAGNDAWEALLHRYEHDGIHRHGDLDEKQRPEETCMDFFNRLVDLQAQLGRVDEEVPDLRLVMSIIRGLRPEYAAMTDTINERDSAVTVEFCRRCLGLRGQLGVLHAPDTVRVPGHVQMSAVHHLLCQSNWPASVKVTDYGSSS